MDGSKKKDKNGEEIVSNKKQIIIVLVGTLVPVVLVSLIRACTS